ncbi:hypothetical protein CLOP_g15050 [Closterium sp. NIES-67]|nr:hypothetical protein CLOP_g15050 [Closterium sp. NIES-67]
MNERGGDANGRGAVPEKTSEPPPSKVEALDGSNYEEWSGRMRSAFKRYKLLKIAVGEEKMPEEGEAHELQQPSRQVEVAVSEEEMSGVTEEGGAAEVEQQQQQQHESPPRLQIGWEQPS